MNAPTLRGYGADVGVRTHLRVASSFSGLRDARNRGLVGPNETVVVNVVGAFDADGVPWSAANAAQAQMLAITSAWARGLNAVQLANAGMASTGF